MPGDEQDMTDVLRRLDEVAGALSDLGSIPARNLYSEQVHGFGGLDEKLLQLYTTAAVAAIANARRYAGMRAVAENLRQALDSRAVTDQATGAATASRAWAGARQNGDGRPVNSGRRQSPRARSE